MFFVSTAFHFKMLLQKILTRSIDWRVSNPDFHWWFTLGKPGVWAISMQNLQVWSRIESYTWHSDGAQAANPRVAQRLLNTNLWVSSQTHCWTRNSISLKNRCSSCFTLTGWYVRSDLWSLMLAYPLKTVIKSKNQEQPSMRNILHNCLPVHIQRHIIIFPHHVIAFPASWFCRLLTRRLLSRCNQMQWHHLFVHYRMCHFIWFASHTSYCCSAELWIHPHKIFSDIF